MNGKPVIKAPLAPGDVITLAFTSITIEVKKDSLFSSDGTTNQTETKHTGARAETDNGYIELLSNSL